MKETELYQHLMGILPPWTVDRVELDLKGEKVDVWVAHPERVLWPCPECATQLPIRDHMPERIWRHLDSCRFKSFLHARPPRVDCPTHGVVQVRLSWAEPHSRFTTFFETMAIALMQETDVLGAAKVLDISWDEAWGIQEQAVARGLAQKPALSLRKMGVDEKSIGHGQQYMTLVYNLESSTVEWGGTLSSPPSASMSRRRRGRESTYESCVSI